ncbi:MAG TPA: response regulator, partial [Anaerolineales bacterium]|nr:response regulator [Anaerolineales bacterium]
MDFASFQRAFTEKYFPEHLTDLAAGPKPGSQTAASSADSEPRPSFLKRFFTRLFGRKNREPVETEPAAPQAAPDSALNPSVMANPPVGYEGPSAATAEAPASPEQERVRPYDRLVSPLPVYSGRADKSPTSPPVSRFTPPFASEDKIRVVVVDDIAETRNNVIRSLSFQEEVVVVGTASTGLEGIRIAAEKQPDVVLMDVNMPDMDGITATAHLRQEAPACEIIILTVQDDVDYMRKAMRAGARDFLTKPPMIEELTAAVLRAGAIAHEQRNKRKAAEAVETLARTPAMGKGKILTLYSPKGGAGCTTLATNLALALHSEDTPVVLVDGDLQFGDVLAFFNAQSRMSLLDLTVRSDELDPELITEVLIDHPSGIRILSAPRPENAESIRPEQFARVLDYLTGMFQYVVVDTGRRLNDPLLAAIDASNLVIVPVTQQIPTIANVRKFLDLAPLLNLERSRVMVIMNQYDKRLNIEPG